MAAVSCQSGSGDEDSEGEELDPRVQVELEKLNHASVEINQLELELDDARASFRQVLSESTQKLSTLAKKLGSAIEKARPYYQSRIEALEAENETRAAALRFERAFSMQQAAKEMVFLAEQGYFRKGQPFDNAWQEMLNHATMKVNEAEVERLESESEHQQTAAVYNHLEQRAKHLQKKLKSSISKSKPYFEMKAKFNQMMEEKKHRVSNLERNVGKAKTVYSDALQSLESISDEIHRQRNEKNSVKALGQRGSGVGAEAPAPPPDMESPSECDVTKNQLKKSTSVVSTQTELAADSLDATGASPRSQRSLSEILQDISPNVKRRSLKGLIRHDSARRRTQELDLPTLQTEPVATASLPVYSDLVNEEYLALPNEILRERSPPKDVFDPLSLSIKVSELEVNDGDRMLKDFKRLPNTHTTSPKLGPAISKHAPAMANTHVPSISIVATSSGQDVKSMPPPNAPVLRSKSKDSEPDLNKTTNLLSPKGSIDELEMSDSESICSSVNVMDDEQIHYLMNDHADLTIPETPDFTEDRNKWKTLPAKLSYLEYYIKYKMDEETIPRDEPTPVDTKSAEHSEEEEVLV